MYNNTLSKKLKKVVTGTLTLALMAAALVLGAQKVHAAGITAMSITGTGITSNSSTVNTAVTPTINFTLPSALNVDAQTIIVSLNGLSVATGQTLEVTDLTLTGCTSSNTLEAAPGTNDNGSHEVSFSATAAGSDNPVITITLDTSTGTLNCGTGAYTLAIAASNMVSHDTTASNYSISIVTSLDSGAFLYYVGDENDVLVTAVVAPTLAFTIRDSTDTADLANVNGLAVGPNLCSLGSLTTGSVATCSYRLKVSTNASSYTVSITSDADLDYGANTIDAITEDSTVTAGTEGYGIAVVGGSATGGTVTESGNFNDDDTPIPTTPTTLLSVSGPNSPGATDTTNTALITHRAAISASTAVGNYDQLVTYTVSGTF